MLKLIHSDLNTRFNMSVVFTANYLLMRDDVSIDNDALLMTDFVNLKIKPVQSFRRAHIGRVYVCIFIRVNTHTYMSIYVYTIS
jgi:hypothetical protein